MGILQEPVSQNHCQILNESKLERAQLGTYEVEEAVSLLEKNRPCVFMLMGVSVNRVVWFCFFLSFELW